jgi:arsenate reductase
MSGIRNGRPSIKGSSRVRARLGQMPAPSPTANPVVFHTLPTPVRPAGRKRVLFVCIGNSCRSQMAEGFAKVYGHDILEVHSAGLSPASIVQDETFETMRLRGVRLEGQHPKGIEMMMRQPFDVVVNMSGQQLPRMQSPRILEWKVRDPIGRSDDVYQEVAAQIENLVKGLIAELRL